MSCDLTYTFITFHKTIVGEVHRKFTFGKNGSYGKFLPNIIKTWYINAQNFYKHKCCPTFSVKE